jgi:hypothetical protein
MKVTQKKRTNFRTCPFEIFRIFQSLGCAFSLYYESVSENQRVLFKWKPLFANYSSSNYQTEILTINFCTGSPYQFHRSKSNYGWKLERWDRTCSLCDHFANFLQSHLLRSGVRRRNTYKTEAHSWPRNEVSFIHHLSSQLNTLWSFSVFSFHRFIDIPRSFLSIRFLTERLFLRIYMDFRRILNRRKCLGGCEQWNFYFKHQTLQRNFSFIQRLVSEENVVVTCENKSIDLNTTEENTIDLT